MKTTAKLIILALAVLWGLVSCAPKAIVISPIAPQVTRASGDVHAAARSAKQLKASVAVVHVEAKGIVAEVNKAAAEVERLKLQPAVTPEDFDALWLMMTDLQTSSWAHEIKVGETVAETVEQDHFQETAVKTLGALELTAEAHDGQVEALKTHLVEVEADAAAGRVYSGWVKFTAAVLALLLVAWIALKALKPAFLR